MNTRTGTYQAWIDMLKKCLNTKHPHFEHYGGAGVKVCERWYSFTNFLRDMGPIPGKGFHIVRTDHNECFKRENCCWSVKRGNLIVEPLPLARESVR